MITCRCRGWGQGPREQESKREVLPMVEAGKGGQASGHGPCPSQPSAPLQRATPSFCRPVRLWTQGRPVGTAGTKRKAAGCCPQNWVSALPARGPEGGLEQVRDGGSISSILGLGTRAALDEVTQRPQGQSDGTMHGG